MKIRIKIKIIKKWTICYNNTCRKWTCLYHPVWKLRNVYFDSSIAKHFWMIVCS